MGVEGDLRLLAAARPDDAFLGEEYGRRGDSGRVWILDPIDGTAFFARDDPNLAEPYFVRDHAPWILIVEESGGRFTNPSGSAAADQGGGIYSNAALHDRLVAALGYPTNQSETRC